MSAARKLLPANKTLKLWLRVSQQAGLGVSVYRYVNMRSSGRGFPRTTSPGTHLDRRAPSNERALLCRSVICPRSKSRNLPANLGDRVYEPRLLI